MASGPFVQLAGNLVEAMGQRLDAAKPTEEGLIVRTGDGFLFAFLEDPAKVSLDAARRLSGESGRPPTHLVVLTPGHLPLVIAQELTRGGATIVEGPRFAELARQLGLGSWLGEEPRATPEPSGRLLPSAHVLDDVMHRARTWLGWGVPALALRFYRQAVDLKPGFLPARIGVGRSLLALGLTADANRQFDEILESHPDDVEARMGKAAVLGAQARPEQEVAVYRKLLEEDAGRTEVRAQLLAALVELGQWPSARGEIETMLSRTPEDPQLRFLHAVALSKTGEAGASGEEREEARRLGLAYDREVTLCEHLGLPPPPRPAVPAPGAAPAGPAGEPVTGRSPPRRGKRNGTRKRK